MVIIRCRGNDELAPSSELKDDWHDNLIDWEEYTERFLAKMENPQSQKRINELAELSHQKDYRLICYETPGDHCHRHLVVGLVENAGGGVPPREEREAPFFS